MEDKAKKAHKKSTKGVKGRKKKEKQAGGKIEKHNPRAHSFSGGVRSVQRRVQFTLDKQTKKDRVPKVDKTPDIPPPFIVVVQGPPGVGKSTLVKSLVRHYCRQRLLEMRGPITLVSGRQRRLTIIECPQEMPAMLDLAKVADLVLLLIDASYGFELETFEFINILQIHGFPRVIGVLTHLDGFHDSKQLRKVKKTMKHRFWSEIYDGAKLFYLSGLQYGRYHRLEVQNLVRFIAVQKGSILSWRQNHPYLLALRWEDQTDPGAPEESPRKLDLYGYVYGGRLREGGQAHLPGVGDFILSSVKALPDPCPAPETLEAEHRKALGKDVDKSGKPKKKNALRTLADRHRLVYAPGSDIGSITVDSDSMYIQLPEHDVGFTGRADEDEKDSLPEAVRMVRTLQSGKVTLNQAAAARPKLRLVGSSTVNLADEEEDGKEGQNEKDPVSKGGEVPRVRRPAPGRAETAAAAPEENAECDDGGDENAAEKGSGAEDCSSERESVQSEESENERCEAVHDGDVHERARARFQREPRLDEVIYGVGPSVKVAKHRDVSTIDSAIVGEATSGTRKATDHDTIPLFDDDEIDGGDEADHAISCQQKNAKYNPLGNLGDIDGLDTSRMAVLPGASDAWDDERKEALKERKFITGGWSSAEEEEDDGGDTKKVMQAGAGSSEGQNEDGFAATDTKPDEQFIDSVPISTFVRVRLEDVPAACVAQMRRERPLILGGLLAGESRLGLVQLRVKRHRWHPKVLKSGDAILLSVGWRRFQTVPTFSLEDRGEKRMRFLKYTLEHAHCTMTYYGPCVPPNTGVLAFRSWQKVSHFRICGTGGVLETAPNFNIMKKLKLVGEPYKIFRNTAFIRGMFTSDLEVNKYAHTKIQTVSKIRGEIKKSEGNRGNFRATFEDRILISDIVICKCWIAVQPKEFYHPVVDVTEWRPARLIGELRAAQGVAVPNNKDSQYGNKIQRAERRFNPLRISKSLDVALPFKTRPKDERKKKKNALTKKTAVVSSDREKAINSLMTRLHTVRKERHRIRQAANTKRRVTKAKREQFVQDKRDAHSMESRKKRYIKEGNEEKKRRRALKLD
eukprot:TRINITY_DN31919_c0_g1_i1.p1 TRINITY_DN31919_c0_g1~~TRINITY_DN31919_c0_g1_i1.p1  ORF type:complete len:1080 (-),score=177.89 TRINITY_DN31919_c0_g1_i1:201-3440(-)